MREIDEKYNKYKMYESDFIRFTSYCEENELLINFDSLIIYLKICLSKKNIKMSTYLRKLAGIKYCLKYKYNMLPTEKEMNELSKLKSLYDKDEFLALKKTEAVGYKSKEDVLLKIDNYNTANKNDVRKRAICLVNLITANKPSEMVRIKIKDFNLEKGCVIIPIKNQIEGHEKRLTPLCIESIKKYIEMNKLTDEDYFVGATDRWGNYTSRQISEISYNQAIQRWLGMAPTALRKVQVIAMYESGADISAIAQQTGQKVQQIILQHYQGKKTSNIDKHL